MRLVLITLALLFTVVGCSQKENATVDHAPVQTAPIEEDVNFDKAYVSACVIDTEHMSHVSALLEENDIDSYMIGSRGFGVMVSADDLKRAREILKKDSEENGDYAKFSEDGMIRICGIDPKLAEHVGTLLSEHQIEMSYTKATTSYGVLVSPTDAALAEELIRNDSEENGYEVDFKYEISDLNSG